MGKEAISGGEDPRVLAISTDPNLLYWMRAIENMDSSYDVEEAARIRDEAWRIAATHHGADPEDIDLRVAVVDRWEQVEAERQALYGQA